MFKSWIAIALMVAAALLAGGCVSSTAGLSAVPAAQAQEYRLTAGDRIRITAPDLQNTDAEYVLDQTGTVSLPLVNEVKLAGLTVREAENAVEQTLVDRRILVRPNVTIQAVSLRPIYILGEVAKPGEYGFKEGLTVFSLVSMAGGYTYRADTKAMEITRNVDGRPVTGKADESTIVLPGDQIRIVEKWF